VTGGSGRHSAAWTMPIATRKEGGAHVATETRKSNNSPFGEPSNVRFARRMDDHWPSKHRLGCNASAKTLRKAKVEPITLQQARHTGATWLDAAEVPPKVASLLMGYATPERQLGAAQITLARYTHALPEDIERARHYSPPILREGSGSR
jgi:integrase